MINMINRDICRVIEQRDDILIYSCVAGMIGLLFYPDDPINGFVVGSWSILCIFTFILIYLYVVINE